MRTLEDWYLLLERASSFAKGWETGRSDRQVYACLGPGKKFYSGSKPETPTQEEEWCGAAAAAAPRQLPCLMMPEYDRLVC